MSNHIDIVFEAPADESGYRFVEVEDPTGHSINAGEWIDRGDGRWALRIQPGMPPLTEAMRAVLRNDHSTYASEDELYAALVEAAGVSVVPQLTDAQIEAEAKDWSLDLDNGLEWCFSDSSLKGFVRALL